MKKLISFLLTLSLILSVSPTVLAKETDSIRIAVIDTGVSTAAIDPNCLEKGQNYADPNASTEDLIGHGTEVTSIIVGSKSAGVEGICPEATIIPLVYRSNDQKGEQILISMTEVGRIIRNAIDIYHCDIINFSSRTPLDTPDLRSAVAYAEEKGVLFVTCAGNDGYSSLTVYPGGYDSTLCVGSGNADISDAARFSNRGNHVDVLAPGIDIPVSGLSGEAKTDSGTSLSTAIVSGLAAKLLMKNPDLTPAQIRNLICACADDIGEAGFDKRTGWGVLNMEQTLACAERGWAFRDVAENEWYSDGIGHVAAQKLMTGTDPVSFSPNTPTTRAMLWTMLFRLDGGNASADPEHWYSDGQTWAIEKKISDGSDPNGEITREQLATMLYRYAEKAGLSVDERADLASFKDAGAISAYALDAVSWANANGLINGVGDSRLDPAGTATRAQIAVIISRFLNTFA